MRSGGIPIPVSRTGRCDGRDRARLAPLSASTVDDDLAGLGELDRVAQQVEQHLAQPGRVADDAAGRPRSTRYAELEPLLRRARATRSSAASTQSPEVERLALELELPGLDLGEVEDVVDDVQEGVAAPADDLGELALLGVSAVSSSSPVMPITAFIGVRISWLMLPRNALFAWVAASASSRACWSSLMSW